MKSWSRLHEASGFPPINSILLRRSGLRNLLASPMRLAMRLYRPINGVRVLASGRSAALKLRREPDNSATGKPCWTLYLTPKPCMPFHRVESTGGLGVLIPMALTENS